MSRQSLDDLAVPGLALSWPIWFCIAASSVLLKQLVYLFDRFSRNIACLMIWFLIETHTVCSTLLEISMSSLGCTMSPILCPSCTVGWYTERTNATCIARLNTNWPNNLLRLSSLNNWLHIFNQMSSFQDTYSHFLTRLLTVMLPSSLPSQSPPIFSRTSDHLASLRRSCRSW